MPYYPQNNAYSYSTAPPEFNPGNFIGTGDYNGAVKQGNYYFTQPVGQATQSNFQYSAPSGSTNQNTVAFSGLNRFGYIRN